jgi:hypothetical protein
VKFTWRESFGALEADAFARHLRSLDLQISHLAKIVEFEEATLATLTDDQRESSGSMSSRCRYCAGWRRDAYRRKSAAQAISRSS